MLSTATAQHLHALAVRGVVEERPALALGAQLGEAREGAQHEVADQRTRPQRLHVLLVVDAEVRAQAAPHERGVVDEPSRLRVVVQVP